MRQVVHRRKLLIHSHGAEIVRHRCHNRRCVNPRHLELGDRLDNLRDERERRANGVDYAML
ncbi:HNH endonuclease [Pseudooceanicola lipolyticus]|uniref:HNH endonuclease n=1 Tax=Pseudooceanicola lipolyticus TaxID=2029104 RepID=UPI0010549B6F